MNATYNNTQQKEIQSKIFSSGIHQIIGIDLFSGAGGFTLAAQNVGVYVVAAIENNPRACNTYEKNFIENKKTPPGDFLKPEGIESALSLFVSERSNRIK